MAGRRRVKADQGQRVRDIEGQTEPASSETSAFSEADEKVIEQLKMRFSKGEK